EARERGADAEAAEDGHPAVSDFVKAPHRIDESRVAHAPQRGAPDDAKENVRTEHNCGAQECERERDLSDHHRLRERNRKVKSNPGGANVEHGYGSRRRVDDLFWRAPPSSSWGRGLGCSAHAVVTVHEGCSRSLT